MESDGTNVYGALSQRRIGYGVRCAKRVSRWVDEGFSWGFWDSGNMPLEEGVMGEDYSRLTSRPKTLTFIQSVATSARLRREKSLLRYALRQKR